MCLALAILLKYKVAIVAFEKAYQLNPNQNEALRYLSLIYQSFGHGEKTSITMTYLLMPHNKKSKIIGLVWTLNDKQKVNDLAFYQLKVK
jgi:hypothetical protein